MSEIATIDRDNAMWRLMRPDQEMAANLDLLRQAGFTTEEVKRIEPELAELWNVPFERHFGWLSPETTEHIQEIDRSYIARMRAARLRASTGIQITDPHLGTPRQVSGQWHWAILKALDYDEIAEFRLMNSPSARRIDVWTAGLTLTDEERRTLNNWQREFEVAHGVGVPEAVSLSSASRWQREDQIDHWRRIRDLLGAGRFLSFLDRASPTFSRMHEALGETGEQSPAAVADLWFARQKYRLAFEQEHNARKAEELASDVRAEASVLLGPDAFARYATQEEARWMFPNLIRPLPPRTKRSASRLDVSPQTP